MFRLSIRERLPAIAPPHDHRQAHLQVRLHLRQAEVAQGVSLQGESEYDSVSEAPTPQTSTTCTCSSTFTTLLNTRLGRTSRGSQGGLLRGESGYESGSGLDPTDHTYLYRSGTRTRHRTTARNPGCKLASPLMSSGSPRLARGESHPRLVRRALHRRFPRHGAQRRPEESCSYVFPHLTSAPLSGKSS